MSFLSNYKRLPNRLYRQYNQHIIRVIVGLIMTIILYMVWRNIGHHDDDSASHSDIRPEEVAIVILGGGLLSDGTVPPHTMLRIERAINLFNEKYQKKATIITLSGGTPHKPNPLDKNGFPVWEASAAAKRLIELGTPSDKVFEENFSLDTVGNAYFLRSVHIIPGHYKKMIVITNRWHMPRTQAIFNRVFSLPMQSQSAFEHEQHSVSSSFKNFFSFCGDHVQDYRTKIELEFEAVGDGIDDAEVLNGRNSREKASLESFLSKVSPQWQSFSQLHTWIFTKHQAYASDRLTKVKTLEMDPAVLKSY